MRYLSALRVPIVKTELEDSGSAPDGAAARSAARRELWAAYVRGAIVWFCIGFLYGALAVKAGYL